MAGRAERGTGREIPALILCLVWAGGFELAPALHALEHHAGHHHVHDAHGHHHVHDAHGHDHGDAHPHHDAHDVDPEPSDPSEHGAGTLAHRGLAAQTPPPALPPIDPPACLAIVARTAIAATPACVSALRPRARAPPV